jgi:Domain of unknown function (DUF4384)
MRMLLPPLTGILCSAAVTLLSGTAALAEEAVIVDTTAPGQTPGTVIGDGQRLSLPDGSSATLIFQSGDMMKLHGPFNGSLPRAVRESAAGLADALRMQGVDVSIVGGSRDLAASARRAMDGGDIRIDPQRSATYCIGRRDTLWLRRPIGGDVLEIRRKETARTVAWPEGALQIPWPDDVMIEDGDHFTFVGKDGNAHGQVSFRRMDTASRGEAAWVAQMFLMGCAEQAQPALREVARAVVSPELYLATDYGRNATYKSGSPVRLTIEANLDGQLYCFAKTAGVGTVPIFPGRARGGARIDAHSPLTIPGERIEMDLHAGGADGVSEVRCYFADRDIASELPASLLDANLAPIPADLASDLATVFKAIPMTRIATASVNIRTE